MGVFIFPDLENHFLSNLYLFLILFIDNVYLLCFRRFPINEYYLGATWRGLPPLYNPQRGVFCHFPIYCPSYGNFGYSKYYRYILIINVYLFYGYSGPL